MKEMFRSMHDVLVLNITMTNPSKLLIKKYFTGGKTALA